MQDNLHPFEAAGLGESPFLFRSVVKNVYSAAPGHQQPGGTCQYCGQGIMYECLIEDRNGNRFTVGMDCVAKLDRADNRLVSAVKREKLKMEREKRDAARRAKWAEQDAKREAELDRQREANGGLTDREAAEQAGQAKRKADRERWSIENQWLISALDCEYQSEFIRGMVDKLGTGPVAGLPDRAVSALGDIYAKQHGRRGSKKYNAALDEFDQRTEATEPAGASE